MQPLQAAQNSGADDSAKAGTVAGLQAQVTATLAALTRRPERHFPPLPFEPAGPPLAGAYPPSRIACAPNHRM